MGYITVAELQSEFKSMKFSATSNPSSSQVETIIDEESNFIDATLNNYVTVPVTSASSPKFYTVLQRICKKIVKNRCSAIMHIMTGTDLDRTSPETLENKARKELRDLVDRKEFYDAVKTADNSYGFSDNNYTNDIDPVFNIEDDESLGQKDYW